MPEVWGIAAIMAKFALYLGILTAAGTVFSAALFQVDRYRVIAAGFAVIGMIAAVPVFAVRGAMLTGDASGLTDPVMLGLLWGTPVGTALAVRVIGLGLLILGLVVRSGGLWISCFGAGVALFSFAQIGHVPDRESLLLVAALLVHLGAVALWIGILIPLRRFALDRAAIQDAAALGHRFGRVATITVPALVIVGIAMSYYLVGPASALLTTGYGQALLVKVGFVTVLLGLAAANKLRFIPAMQSGHIQAATQLSKSIMLEWGVILAVLATTATLTSSLTLPV